jgi:hypothetical protein
MQEASSSGVPLAILAVQLRGQFHVLSPEAIYNH